MATQKGRNWSSGDIVTAANLSSIERGVSAVAEEYTPTTWANGDAVTAAALNNIEQGIANAGGGSSDFSTATVTLNPTVPSGYEITWWNLMDVSIPPYAENTNEYYKMAEMTSETSNQFTILLYRGVGYFEAIGLYDGIHDVGLWIENPTLSENITWNSEMDRYIVTGDCTISGLTAVYE